ncbi:hypothetical protein PIB30_045339 [Stylosanthes scabra]|uniref:Uncharacterized protein n=1 Tax=Stylosanthes scabra TaxID=79078 RepID=A0ABU6ZEX1_9FABA|nr:hypothetical protein [Stylosanthes scabra]
MAASFETAAPRTGHGRRDDGSAADDDGDRMRCRTSRDGLLVGGWCERLNEWWPLACVCWRPTEVVVEAGRRRYFCLPVVVLSVYGLWEVGWWSVREVVGNDLQERFKRDLLNNLGDTFDAMPHYHAYTSKICGFHQKRPLFPEKDTF